MNIRLAWLALLTTVVLGACGGDADDIARVEDPDDDPIAEVLDRFGIDDNATEGNDSANPGDAVVTPSTGTSTSRDDDSSGGTLQVGDLVFEIDKSEFCLTSSQFFQLESAGRAGDTVAWISISGDIAEDYDGDDTPDPTATVLVAFGQSAGFPPAEEGQAELLADVVSFSAGSAGFSEFEFVIAPGSMSGAGEITDSTGIHIPFGESQPFSFTALC